MSRLPEYRGSKNWAGLIPAEKAPRVWDDGFRSFLLKYGMLNHVVYDVYIKGDKDYTNEQGLRGTSRFGDDLDAFSQKGLKFNYVNKAGEKKTEYDFTGDYKIIGNLVSSPRSFFTSEDNWFGFVALSNDTKELLIVFRGTQTLMEWAENATCHMTQLTDEPPVSGLAYLWNKGLMVHAGFQQLYEQESVQGIESPKETVHRLVQEHKGTIDKVTVLGHSLGAGVAQLCAVQLARSNVLGDVPILGIAWGAPKIGNKYLVDWVEQQQNLRILRIRCPVDLVSNMPPDWLWAVLTGGYKDMGTVLNLDNTNLCEEGIVKDDAGNDPHHNLMQYIHNIDPTRDPALLNKFGDVVPDALAKKNNISPMWHNQTWPRTVYN